MILNKEVSTTDFSLTQAEVSNLGIGTLKKGRMINLLVYVVGVSCWFLGQLYLDTNWKIFF